MPPPLDRIEHWHRTLAYFRFVPAVGGPANDLDSLDARIGFSDGEAGLLDAVSRLGVALEVIPDDAPRVVPGRAYRADEWATLVSPIRAYPRFREPGLAQVLGVTVALFVEATSVRIAVCGAEGNLWDVTERDFENAARLERALPALGLRLLSPDGEQNRRAR